MRPKFSGALRAPTIFQWKMMDKDGKALKYIIHSLHLHRFTFERIGYCVMRSARRTVSPPLQCITRYTTSPLAALCIPFALATSRSTACRSSFTQRARHIAVAERPLQVERRLVELEPKPIGTSADEKG